MTPQMPVKFFPVIFNKTPSNVCTFLWCLQGPADLNIKLRKILNGSNLIIDMGSPKLMLN
jgi:hypothetical protein